ncbi:MULTISPECIES: RNA polymerase-binding protein DksA [Thermodesulfovibrio]|jgi:DnaK suppressor protein|uniref:RNA polymerase-binding transcription factor DksA n=2 Tax=Thermodesulfovibrio yellowstonii TaxID=28262 RepID=B5YK78_THEYD|nr:MULTISPECIES: RNA polymerase-binding protein DksA [Thermodesulfovibrio]ACI20338.1 RNA polymerase-binding protein DksA [Thermodesulfovibrio yellowstonii DSM 11347]MDI6865316.1 RNA polymerase-binding protein DksA [Thermodesulfovibrio yellowstonii]GLI53808.1 RNA polymerase-binding transcription factor DksA [Thermodesulfovibrio islandicus]
MKEKSRQKRILEIKKKLLQQKQQILIDAGIMLSNLPSESNLSEIGDIASQEIDRSFLLRLRDRERKLLKKIEKTLEKINNGTYGICEACGAEIPIERLEARPVTDLCIECKTEQEEAEKLKES